VRKGEASASGERRIQLWGGKNGPTGPCSFVQGFQSQGGRESGRAPGVRRTSTLSKDSGGGAESKKEHQCLFFVTLLAFK